MSRIYQSLKAQFVIAPFALLSFYSTCSLLNMLRLTALFPYSSNCLICLLKSPIQNKSSLRSRLRRYKGF